MIVRKAVTGAVIAALLGAATTPPPVAKTIAPIDGPNYTPQDKDERGLWMQMDEDERLLKTSNFVVRDTALNAYVRDVFCRTVGPDCAAIRIYITRTPYFNASMAPNGAMVVYTGLLLRIRDEAQLAAILGHEFTHYKNRHSLQLWRDARAKSGSAMFFAMFGLVGSLIAIGTLASVFEFSRDMEREADTGSLHLMAHAGYAPASASQVWSQLRAEMDATALARGTKSRKDKNGGIFGTHPPTAERMESLAKLAATEPVTGTPVVNRAQYRAALANWWGPFIDDQIKLNDFGGTELLLQSLAAEGWTDDLLYARGELYRTRGRPEDLTAAIGYYKQALAMEDPPVECWRGLGLALLRSGQQGDGQAALKTYLSKKSDASDRAMIAMLAGEAG